MFHFLTAQERCPAPLFLRSSSYGSFFNQFNVVSASISSLDCCGRVSIHDDSVHDDSVYDDSIHDDSVDTGSDGNGFRRSTTKEELVMNVLCSNGFKSLKSAFNFSAHA